MFRRSVQILRWWDAIAFIRRRWRKRGCRSLFGRYVEAQVRRCTALSAPVPRYPISTWSPYLPETHFGGKPFACRTVHVRTRSSCTHEPAARSNPIWFKAVPCRDLLEASSFGFESASCAREIEPSALPRSCLPFCEVTGLFKGVFGKLPSSDTGNLASELPPVVGGLRSTGPEGFIKWDPSRC